MRIRGRTRNQNPGQSGPDPGPESVPGQEWPDPDSGFFFVFDFSLVLMPLNHGKERCRPRAKAKAKAKANKKQSGLLFLWLGCVLLGWPIFFYPSMATFSFLYQWPGSQSGPVPTYVVSRSLLLVTQSGSDPAARHGSVPQTDAI